MKWKKHDTASIVSEDGCYSVCQIAARTGSTRLGGRGRTRTGRNLISTNLANAQEARRPALEDSVDE